MADAQIGSEAAREWIQEHFSPDMKTGKFPSVEQRLRNCPEGLIDQVVECLFCNKVSTWVNYLDEEQQWNVTNCLWNTRHMESLVLKYRDMLLKLSAAQGVAGIADFTRHGGQAFGQRH